MSLPEMTPLQFLLVRLLFDGRQSGARLRQRLATAGVNVSRSAFSQLMERAVKMRYLCKSHDACRPDGRAGRECSYELTDLGMAVWKLARAFYAQADPPPDLAVVETDTAALAHLPHRERSKILYDELHKTIKRTFMAMLRHQQAGKPLPQKL